MFIIKYYWMALMAALGIQHEPLRVEPTCPYCGKRLPLIRTERNTVWVPEFMLAHRKCYEDYQARSEK